MKIAIMTAAIFAGLVLPASPAQARNYDCSKAGNASKAACKGNASAQVPMAPVATTAGMTKPRNYDCTKFANKFRAVCKGQSAVAPAPAPMAARSATMAQTAPPMRGGDKLTHASGPNGATAMCKDGSYSHSTHHSGTCSGHHGVATWY